MVIKILLTLDIDEEEYRMPADGKIEEEIDKNWTLHEKLFKKGPTHEVDPKILVKSS